MGKKGSSFLKDSCMNIINFGGSRKKKRSFMSPQNKNVSFAFQKGKKKSPKKHLKKTQNVSFAVK